jgi:dTDP-4-amino-4,6-dideoxygalactose transaminase
VLAEISASSLSSSLPQIRAQLTEKTVGVMVVHIGGLIPPDMDQILAFCREQELFVLEDAAHAHGAARRGKRAGSLGDAAGFSFFPTKVMTCGEGGMLTTADAGLAEFARSFRCHGIATEGRELVRLGANYRLPELSAALGLKQLGRLDEFVRERNRLVGLYRAGLAEIPGLGLFEVPQDQVHAYYKFPVLLPAACERGEVLQGLQDGFGVVGGSLYWPPCHLQPFYREGFGYSEGSFPVAEEVLNRTITLPLFNDLEDGDVERVCQALKKVLKQQS